VYVLIYSSTSGTHGQPATPTTLGKEIAVFSHRLLRAATAFQVPPQPLLDYHLHLFAMVVISRIFQAVTIRAKMNGATGNFSAHAAAAPQCDWRGISRSVIEGVWCSAHIGVFIPQVSALFPVHSKQTNHPLGFGLEVNTHTTQIEPHDYMAEMFMALRCISFMPATSFMPSLSCIFLLLSHFNTIMIDLSRDVWAYIRQAFAVFSIASLESIRAAALSRNSVFREQSRLLQAQSKVLRGW
jgi:adenylosuccinate lyase